MRSISKTGLTREEVGPAEDLEAVKLLSLVARDKNVPVRLLLHHSRCRASVAATRQLAMYLMHVALGRSLTDVGRMFGRDRTTVSHACARIEDLRDLPRFDADVTRLENVLSANGNAGHDAS
jgi:chromosomal replication initiation ATPase DnaA